MASTAGSFDAKTPQTTEAAPVPSSARDAACQAIAEQVVRFPDLNPLGPDTRKLDPRDAALAAALYDVTIRRWITLEHCIAPRLRQPVRDLHPAVRAALLVGAAQLLLLDRVPDHAAIYETVEWAKRHAPKRTVSLVNAILRGISRSRGEPASDASLDSPEWLTRDELLPLGDGRSLPLDGLPKLGDPAKRLAVLTSHRQWLVSRWVEHYGLEGASRFCAHGLVVAPLVLYTRHAQRAIVDRLEQQKAAAPHQRPGHHVWLGPISELSPLLNANADIWVQDPASSHAIDSVDIPEPGLIVDLCAGRGTKTRQLLARFPGARVIASDTDERRLSELEQGLGGNERVQVAPMERLLERTWEKADLVLLDVPCSNTGVLARRLEARYRCSAKQLRRLVRLQREIGATASGLRAPEGRLLYSTCSMEIEENHAQSRAIADEAGLALLAEDVVAPSGWPGEPPTTCTDGSYWALLGPSGG